MSSLRARMGFRTCGCLEMQSRTMDASTRAHDGPTMRKVDLYASLFDLPSFRQIGNDADTRPADAPTRREGIAK